MKILLASSEAYPYSKSGGLADMLGALAKFLGRAGHQVGLVTPLYRCVRHRFPGIQPMDWRLDLPLGRQHIQAKVCVGLQADGETIYFIDHPPFYDRGGIIRRTRRRLSGQRGAFHFLFQMRRQPRPLFALAARGASSA